MPAPEARERIETGLEELGLDLAPEALDRLAELSELVADWGQRLNLTGHRGSGQIAHRLVLDALALLQPLPPFDSLVDLGSGAGFPGLPIAIARPQARVTLVEARERRHHFQRHAIRSLGLANVVALRGRMEDLEPRGADLVVAQAVASPEDLSASLVRWSSPGGHVAVPGGTLERSAAAEELGLLEPRTLEYRVPLDGPRRTVWIARNRS